MTSTFQDSVLDFDLNFLQQSSSNAEIECKIEKQKKAILIAKKKTIATDLLIRKYYDKKDKLEETEVTLLASKEECKQVCIEYKKSVEKCIQLEKEVQLLQSRHVELEQNYIASQNQVEAMNSHARQLQGLIKENETVIESLKIDNCLEKNNTKDFEKKILALEKEHEEILNHLCLARDIAFGKRKLQKHHKTILQKYENISEKDGDCLVSGESSEETDFFDDPPTSPLYTVIEICPEVPKKKEVDTEIDVKACIKLDAIRVIEDHESDYSNGVVSEDTGRGSSLAFSDSDKCVNSPDYFATNSPPTEPANIKNKKVFVDASTSPRKKNEAVHRATSPLTFDDEDLLRDNRISANTLNTNEKECLITNIPLSDEIVAVKEKPQSIDIATSPIRDIEKVTIATSPVIFMDISETSPCISEAQCITSVGEGIVELNNNSVNGDTNEIRSHTVFEDLSTNCELEISKSREEKECLENNNSGNLQNENSNDYEVEMILKSMRLSHKLITPLPQTPVKPNKKVRRQLETVVEKTDIERHVCPDALELREENKRLETSIADLTKEILNIKNVLKKQLIMPESPKKLPNQINAESLNRERLDDDNQETIILACDEDDNGITIRNDESVTNGDRKDDPYEKLQESNQRTSPVMEIEATLTNNEQDTQSLLLNSDAVQTSLPLPRVSTPEPPPPPEHTHPDSHNETGDVNDSHITCSENLSFEERSEIVTVDNTCKNINKDNIRRSKKLSRLDKFRRRLVPKSKIKIPLIRKRAKCKIIPVTKLNSSDAGLNNKVAYEKAIKIMKELKLKQKLSNADHFVNSTGKRVEINQMESAKVDSNNIDVQRSPVKLINEPKQFVVCLSRLNLDKHMQNIKNAEERESDRNKCIRPEVASLERKKQDVNEFFKDSSPTKNARTTRSRCKTGDGASFENFASIKSPRKVTLEEADEIIKKYDRTERTRRRLKRLASDSSDISCKRVLRSNVRDSRSSVGDEQPDITSPTRSNKSGTTEVREKSFEKDNSTNYSKLHTNKTVAEILNSSNNNVDVPSCNSQVADPRQSILCKMIEKYGRGSVKFAPKKISDNITNQIYKKLENDIACIVKLSIEESKPAVNKLVDEIRELNKKHFMSGLMKYLKDPQRKQELFNKVSSAPAPPMTKVEQVLLYILKEIVASSPDFVNMTLTHIEFALFHLNKTPDFDVIESLSHFYALTCRYFRMKTRLRLFLLDAMYCLQFKVLPLIKQCLDVWMHILPLAHMGIAKSPLVTCLVYLLHFYKCEDRFNRIQEIRMILNKKYFYKMADWNEPKILEMFKNCLTELREIPHEKKMLRLSFIILAKRHGPKWCQKNIIRNMLTPLIDNEDVPMKTKKFCASLLGPLQKPYPKDMKVHCEISVNQLLDKLNEDTPDDMKEAIFTSLIYMSKHNQNRVTQALLSWSPKQPSEEFEQLMCDFVREKPVRVWKGILSKITL